MNVLQLANYVISYASDQGKFITNLKLQKTLYYIQGYSLKYFSKPAFPEDIRNWQYGPVSPTAYFTYSSYGSNPLEKNEQIEPLNLNGSTERLYHSVIDSCLAIPARKLVQKTHDESPWANTKQNEVITPISIKKYFENNNPLQINHRENHL